MIVLKNINMTLDPESIENAIQEVERFERVLKPAMQCLIEYLASKGLEIARAELLWVGGSNTGGGANGDEPIENEAWETGALSESIRYVGGADFEIEDPDQARRHALCAYDSAVRLFAVLCQSYHLDSSAIISHCEGSLLGVASDHKDPEHLWAGLELDLTMDRFRADVKEKAKDASLRWISGPPFKKKHPFWKRLRSFILNG